jgi:hypothetical protein
MTDLLLSEKGTYRRLIITRDKVLDPVYVDGATMVKVDFKNAKDFERIYC